MGNRISEGHCPICSGQMERFRINERNSNDWICSTCQLQYHFVPQFHRYEVHKRRRASSLMEDLKQMEAAYKGNIGFIELVAFYKEATPAQVKKMERITKAEDWEAFKRLIKKVIGRDLI